MNDFLLTAARSPHQLHLAVRDARRRCGLLGAALAILLAAPASAATLAATPACVYGGKGRDTASIAAAGFAPNAPLRVEMNGDILDASGEWLTLSDLSQPLFPMTDASGALQAIYRDLSPGTDVSTVPVTATDGTSTASASFELARPLFFLYGPGRMHRYHYGARPVWTISGFGPNREVYAHYIYLDGGRRRVLATVHLGRTTGACGDLTVHRRLWPSRRVFRRYVYNYTALQLDSRRRPIAKPDGLAREVFSIPL